MPGTYWVNTSAAANSGWHRSESGTISDAALGPRFNAMVAFFPFIEAISIYDAFAAGNIEPWSGVFLPGSIPILHCPSDRNTLNPGRNNGCSMSNISLSLGDSLSIMGNTRGVVSWPYPCPFRATSDEGERKKQASNVIQNGIGMGAITDGTSNTVFCSEIVVATSDSYANAKGGISRGSADSRYGAGGGAALSGYTLLTGNCMNEGFTSDRRLVSTPYTGAGKGRRALDAWPHYGWVINTLMPPNAPNCAREMAETSNQGAFTAQSFHAGGVNVGFADGSIRFVADSVDTNNVGGGTASLALGGHPQYDGASTFGVWGALGSIAGGESKSL